MNDMIDNGMTWRLIIDIGRDEWIMKEVTMTDGTMGRMGNL
jgi:hypothetical protein